MCLSVKNDTSVVSILFSIIASNLTSPVRLMKGVTCGIIVSKTFSAGDCLDIFQMSQVTFISVCNEQLSVERTDTEII